MRGSFEAKYKCLFPYTWHVEAKLLLLFCEHTREQVTAVLGRFETESVDVPLLVAALRCTMQFERVFLSLLHTITGAGAEDGPGEEQRATGELSVRAGRGGTDRGQRESRGHPAALRAAAQARRRCIVKMKTQEEREAQKAAEKERAEAAGKPYVNTLVGVESSID